ncbi:MAG: phage protein Gp36 family protein [Phycisphaerae bacterium]
MAYITVTQLSERLGATIYTRLTDREGGKAASAAVAAQIVAEAEAEADSYLARRFATPVDLSARPELAAVLQARVLDLAEHGAWKGSPFVNDLPSRVRALYAAAIAWFEEVARGAVELPAAAPAAGRVATNDAARVSGSARTLTADELDGL